MLRRTAVLAILVALLAGCGTPATTTGRIALVALIQEPGLLSPFFNDQSGSDITSAFVVEPIFLAKPDGDYLPYLASEIPTLANGGVSADGKRVTVHLRHGITWSDGMPFTAQDLKFTVDVFQNPKSATQTEPEYELVDRVRVVDPYTAEVLMKEPNPAFLSLFQQVLPKHKFSSTAVTAKNPQARLPLGTGPFVYVSWSTGDRITLKRNPHYWRDPSLPKLDGITVKVTPDKQSTMSAFINGEADAVFFFTGNDLQDVQAGVGQGLPLKVVTDRSHVGSVEWLWFNFADHGNDSRPHPVLGDPAVREAIDRGIDRNAIINGVLGGFGTASGAFVYTGWAGAKVAPTPYDPDRANRLLDAAGWKRGPDGVRAKNGVRASLKYQTISGDQTRVLYQQLVQYDLRKIGIELKIQNVPSNIMLGGYQDGGLLATGNYDIMMSRAGADSPDPGAWTQTFTTTSIPTRKSPDGFTYSHWSNPRYDKLYTAAASEVDRAKRLQDFQQMGAIFTGTRVALPLYGTVRGWAWNSQLHDVRTDFWDGIWTTASSAYWQFG